MGAVVGYFLLGGRQTRAKGRRAHKIYPIIDDDDDDDSAAAAEAAEDGVDQSAFRPNLPKIHRLTHDQCKNYWSWAAIMRLARTFVPPGIMCAPHTIVQVRFTTRFSCPFHFPFTRLPTPSHPLFFLSLPFLHAYRPRRNFLAVLPTAQAGCSS